jgi:hypothetical protein
METHGVRRLVCETSLGIGDSAGRMGLYYTLFVIPVILPFYFWDKTRQERVIAESDAEWVIVRPGALTNGKRRGNPRHGSRIGSVVWTVRISRPDVAGFMLDQLESDAFLRAAPGVCGQVSERLRDPPRALAARWHPGAEPNRSRPQEERT